MNEEEIIICRCEDITLADIRCMLQAGVDDVEEMKRLLRCGMGPCQGRTCRPLIMQEVASHRGVDLEDMKVPVFRPPFIPVKLGLLAEAYERRGEQDNGQTS